MPAAEKQAEHFLLYNQPLVVQDSGIRLINRGNSRD
jgi:hypothetical protein